MLPMLDYNVVNPETTRYKRTHNTAVAQTEEQLRALYGAWKVILCNCGLEALNTALDLVQPRTVIVDDETYFELRQNLQYHQDWCRYHYIQLPDLNDMGALEQALQGAEKPVIVCGDNPTTFGSWKDVKAISDMAHRYGAYVMMDNSIVSLYYSNPLKAGADIVVESYTKFVTGQGDTFAGGIALAPSMAWLDEKEVPSAVPGMKSITWVVSRRGNIAHPRSAYNVSKGLETLSLRMERHTRSARFIAKTLKAAGLNVRYPGVGGLITLLGMKPDFCSRFQHFVTVGTFGCAYSNADFFRSDAFYKTGICTRLSIGLEDPDILIRDIEQAMQIPLWNKYLNVRGEDDA